MSRRNDKSTAPADKLTRIAIVSNDKCKPKRCRQECKKSCPVVRMGKPFLCFFSPVSFRGALGVCFALKSWKEYLLLVTYLITFGKDVTFQLITKFKTKMYLNYLSVNQIPN